MLKTPQELAADNRRIAAGEQPTARSVNEVTQLPEGFTRWVRANRPRIEAARRRGTLPYFFKDNLQSALNIIDDKTEARRSAKRIVDKLRVLTKPRGNKAFVAFDPFSPIIARELSKIKTGKLRQKLFDEIYNDESFVELYRDKGVSTKVHPLHKTKGNWVETLNMARHLNRKGIPVAFLPEYEDITSADAIAKLFGKWEIVDFKYMISTNANTMQGEFKKAFEQASAAVVQLTNADLGQFREAIEYLKRNKIKLGNMIVMNEYGKVVELSHKDLRLGYYNKKLRGFL